MDKIYQLDELEGSEKELAKYLFEKTGKLPGEYGFIDGRMHHLSVWDNIDMNGFTTANKYSGFTIFKVDTEENLTIFTKDREEQLKQMVDFLNK